MRKGFAVAALICAILGLIAGLNEWFMNQYVLSYVDWSGPLQSLADISWFMETFLIGIAVILIAVAVMQPAAVEYIEVDYGMPPPVPTPVPSPVSAVPPPIPTHIPILPELSPDYDKEPSERPWPRRLK